MPPIVGCVPINNRCLSGVDTKLILDLVGAFVISTALVDVPSEGFHSNAPPFNTVAIKFSPKLSNDQFLASSVTLDEDLGVFHVDAPQVSVPQPKAGTENSGPIPI